MGKATPANYHHFLGIDVSKDTIDCLLRPSGTYSQWTNRDEGFGRLHRWLSGHHCSQQHTLICIKDTGIYSDRLLAEYGQRYTDRITLTGPPEEAVKQLQQLYAERQRLIKARGATQNRSQQAAHALVDSELLARQWDQQLQLYNRQIEALESEVRDLIRNHPGLNEYYELLRTIPVVGEVTGWLWLMLFYGEDHLNHKQITSRFGFAPHRFRSGSSVRGKTRSSGHGNTQIRSCMSMVARSVSHHHTSGLPATNNANSMRVNPWPVVRNNLINPFKKEKVKQIVLTYLPANCISIPNIANL